jgi:hypothetical protein
VLATRVISVPVSSLTERTLASRARRRQAGRGGRLSFEAAVIHWRGPSPFFFAPLPPPQAASVREVARFVTYGWGCIPVEASIGGVAFKTSLFPKDDTYLLPIKVAVRRKTGVTVGDVVAVDMTLRHSHRFSALDL